MSGVGSHGEIIVVQKHRRDGVREVACVELLLYPAELRRRDQAGAAETLAAETLAVWRSLPVRNRVKPGLRRPRGRQPPPPASSLHLPQNYGAQHPVSGR